MNRVQPQHLDLSAIDWREVARRKRRLASGGSWGMWLAVAMALLWMVPFYYLLITIFKSPAEFATGPKLALPEGLWPVVGNVSAAWQAARMGPAFLNSAIYAVTGAASAVIIAAMAAHGLARFDFRGRTALFMTIFAGTVFPLQLYLIPLFFSYQSLGLIDTRLGMILFYTAICIPFPVLVLRNYMSQMSREMDEAARMDGCGEFRLFFSIVLPNASSPMLALFLLQFTWVWNDLLFATVLTQSPELRPIMPALQVFQGGYASQSPTVILTASFLASLPTVLLFLAMRRTFMTGLTAARN
jgi:ABC-type glycerol-3-phosphate transport system permease component